MPMAKQCTIWFCMSRLSPPLRHDRIPILTSLFFHLNIEIVMSRKHAAGLLKLTISAAHNKQAASASRRTFSARTPRRITHLAHEGTIPIVLRISCCRCPDG